MSRWCDPKSITIPTCYEESCHVTRLTSACFGSTLLELTTGLEFKFQCPQTFLKRVSDIRSQK
ncbi:hypothetical protein Mapa_009068 [Marchantia paleacea]|nr:hypothetical protein Mapa_009068 [Marchantia paleacea]